MLLKAAEYIKNKHLSRETVKVSYDNDYKIITIPIIIIDNKVPILNNTNEIENAIHEAAAHKKSIFYRLNFLVNGLRMSEYEFAHYAACKIGYVDFAIMISEAFWKNKTKDDLLNDCFTPVSFELLFAPIRKCESDTLAREKDQAKLALQIIKLSNSADWGHIGTAQSHILGPELLYFKIPQELKDKYYYNLTKYGNPQYFQSISTYKNTYKFGNLWLENISDDTCCAKCALEDGEEYFNKHSDYINLTKENWDKEILKICEAKGICVDCEDTIEDEDN
jgi:hypothetical protein